MGAMGERNFLRLAKHGPGDFLHSVPDADDRYYLMPMYDAWTNAFASPGTRTTGSGAGNFAIVGPTWNGTLPNGLTKIESPTGMVAIGGRVLQNGPADIAAAHPEESGMTDNITVLYQDGQNQADLQNYTGALSLYQKALAIDPNNVKVLADMGRVLYNLHNYTGAISAVDKALTIEPRHAYALESKGFLLYELGDYKQALGYLNKALELNVSYQTLNIKGLDLTKLGDYGQAISAFNTAIAVNPDDDSPYYNKALTLTDLALHDHNRDDINLALQNVDKAIDMNVYDRNAESLKLSLGQLLFWAQHD